MTLDEAQDVARIANSTDGGVPQPRADVVELRPRKYAVDVRSLTIVMSGSRRWAEVDSQRVYSRPQAIRLIQMEH